MHIDRSGAPFPMVIYVPYRQPNEVRDESL
jgi:hypothetical protein